jgi:hypothetical protein
VGFVRAPALAVAHPPVVDFFDESIALAHSEKDLVHGIQAAVLRSQRFEITQVQVADIIDREVIPKWVQATARFQGARTRAPSCYREFLRPFGDFVDLRLRTLGLISEAVRKNDNSIFQVAMKQGEEADALLRHLQAESGGD